MLGIEVADKLFGTLQEDLAFLAAGHLALVIIDDAHPSARQQAPVGRGANLERVLRTIGGDGRMLGGTIRATRCNPMLCGEVYVLGGDGGAAQPEESERGNIVATALRRFEDAHQKERRAAGLLDTQLLHERSRRIGIPSLHHHHRHVPEHGTHEEIETLDVSGGRGIQERSHAAERTEWTTRTRSCCATAVRPSVRQSCPM